MKVWRCNHTKHNWWFTIGKDYPYYENSKGEPYIIDNFNDIHYIENFRGSDNYDFSLIEIEEEEEQKLDGMLCRYGAEKQWWTEGKKYKIYGYGYYQYIHDDEGDEHRLDSVEVSRLCTFEPTNMNEGTTLINLHEQSESVMDPKAYLIELLDEVSSTLFNNQCELENITYDDFLTILKLKSKLEDK